MDIFFRDPNEIPLPPGEVRIRKLRAEPWPDGQRVRITCELDPFQKRPNLDFVIMDGAGEKVTATSVIEALVPKIEFTMHLPRPGMAGSFIVQAVLFYSEPVEAEPGEPSGDEPSPPPEQVITIIDRQETVFTIIE